MAGLVPAIYIFCLSVGLRHGCPDQVRAWRRRWV